MPRESPPPASCGEKGGPEDDAEASRWYRKASERGGADAQSALGGIYADSGRDVPKDYLLAHRWTNIAIANGIEEAREFQDKRERDMTAPRSAAQLNWLA